MKLLRTETQSIGVPKPQFLCHLHGFLGQPVSPLGSYLFHIPHGKAAAPLPVNYLKCQCSSVQGPVGSICPYQLHAHTTSSCPASPLYSYSCLYTHCLLILALPPLHSFGDATLLGSSERDYWGQVWGQGLVHIRQLWKQMCSR